VTTYLLVAVFAVAYPLLALWQLRTKKLRDRLDLLIVLAAALLFLLAARALADWQAVPPWLWLVGLGLAGVAIGYSGWVWPHLTWLGSDRPRRRATFAGIQLVIAAALMTLLV